MAQCAECCEVSTSPEFLLHSNSQGEQDISCSLPIYLSSYLSNVSIYLSSHLSMYLSNYQTDFFIFPVSFNQITDFVSLFFYLYNKFLSFDLAPYFVFFRFAIFYIDQNDSLIFKKRTKHN